MIALSSRGRLLTFAWAALSAGCRGGSDESESEPTSVVAVQTAVAEARPFTESIGAIGKYIYVMISTSDCAELVACFRFELADFGFGRKK